MDTSWGGKLRAGALGGRDKEREGYVCEFLSGYYGNSTGLSVSLQNDLLRRLELFNL